MVKMNASRKEKNVRFWLKRVKVLSRFTKSTGELTILLLIYKIVVVSILDFKKLMINL